MSEKVHQSKNSEHGTILSYATGFALSLLLTFIPYYLVVNKVFSGKGLWLAILTIGVLQMSVQLLFFLHLGRGPKPLYNIVFFFATAGVIIITIGASLFIMDNLYRTMSPQEMTQKLAQQEGIAQVGGKETGACGQLRDNHVVTIANDTVYPIRTEAKLCDTLTFVNKDGDDRDLLFASYFGPESYGGEDKVHVRSGRPEVITLNQEGDFSYFDERNPDITGYFIVSR